MEATLSHGVIGELNKVADNVSGGFVLQVKSMEPAGGKYRGTVADGRGEMPCVFMSQLNELAEAGTLHAGCTIKVLDFTVNTVAGVLRLFISGLDVMAAADASVAVVTLSTPRDKVKAEPAANSGAGLALSPEQPSAKYAKTPSGAKATTPGGTSAPTPPSASQFAPASVSTKTGGFASIDDLHPYKDDWCLKAKVDRKSAPRTINTKAGPTTLMNVELVDAAGRKIQGTFWRGQAERWGSAMQEGRVYVFTHFKVRAANKQYSTVKNDYEIQFDDKTDVCEAADQAAGEAMRAAVDIVPIEALPRHVNKKAAVDVLGVVTAVGQQGTVKRKADNAEVVRRDITLVDASSKSVVLTVWGEDKAAAVAALEGKEGTVVQVTSCRVGDYNGCSLSSLQRSEISVAPDSEEARKLASWWSAQGATAAITPVGGDAAAARTPGGTPEAKAAARNALHGLKEVSAQPVPMNDDARPTYHNVIAVVTNVNPDQTLYYLANPETGKKVSERDGRFYEADGRVVDKASHRYVLNMRLMDSTGDAYGSAFNDEGAALMGCSADELAALKNDAPEKYARRVKAAQFTGDWAITLSSKAREYNGDRKMKHTVVSARPVNPVQDGHRLLEAIQRYC